MTSISDSVLAGVVLPTFPWAGILIVSFSLAWLCINLAMCSHCSDCVGLLARREVMSAFDRPMFSVMGLLSHVWSFSFPLPFSFLFWFGLVGRSFLWFGWFFFCVFSLLCGIGLSPNLMWHVLHSLCELAWLPLQLTQCSGVSSGWSPERWSLDPHSRHHGVVQLLEACENIPHLLHWYT